MKNILALMTAVILLASVMPIVLADGADDGIGIVIDIDEPENSCPVIYQDPTQRAWYPNDQTWYTATKYGECQTNLYGDEYCVVPERGNYVFKGETLTYYVIVEDANGKDDIDFTRLENLGACSEIAVPTVIPTPYTTWSAYAQAKFGISAWNANTMALYKCKVIVASQTESQREIVVQTTDGDATCNSENYGIVEESKEFISFNPDLSVDLVGTINFGSVVPGSVATSTPIRIENDGDDGVVMDMYIDADDYFTDTNNEEAICGDGNGIKHDRFSYYASKGSINSGRNDNTVPGLGEPSGICIARADEYTLMPSHSGEIADMCRVINYIRGGSFLTEGDYMSIRFRLDVPSNCEPASYTDGEFHVVGRVL